MLIMHEIRLPRALLAALVGFSLGVSGAALQGFLRNPLAEPGIIGVSASAALGAVLMFYTGMCRCLAAGAAGRRTGRSRGVRGCADGDCVGAGLDHHA
jgi:iron complex transport system permease protein